METDKRQVSRKGISIITCTNKPIFIDNIFNNYKNQVFKNKELIIILNRDDMNFLKYNNMGKKFKNVSVFRLPEKTSIGYCLNFAIRKAKYDCIAKFDDDDYYSPYYVAKAMETLKRRNVDVVGKATVYLYLESRKTLYTLFPDQENKFVSYVTGSTIMFKKKIFKQVKFPNRSLGEDVYFLLKCKAKGYKIYSSDKFNYVYIRRRDLKNHTWKVKETKLLRTSKIVGYTVNFKKFVNRS